LHPKRSLTSLSRAVISGEAVLHCRRPHWVVLAVPMIVGVFCALPGLVKLAVWLIMEDSLKPTPSGFATIVTLGVAGLLWLASLLNYLSASFTITSRRLILQQGVIRRKRMEILLADVGAIDIVESTVGEVLGYGSIVVHQRDGGEGRFGHVADPTELGRTILEPRNRVLERLQEARAA
jgi:uncharacterized membrane protein YdbT with pleckstrin-like domain